MADPGEETPKETKQALPALPPLELVTMKAIQEGEAARLQQVLSEFLEADPVVKNLDGCAFLLEEKGRRACLHTSIGYAIKAMAEANDLASVVLKLLKADDQKPPTFWETGRKLVWREGRLCVLCGECE